MKIYLTTIQETRPEGLYEATVFEDSDGFYVEYKNPSGIIFKTEHLSENITTISNKIRNYFNNIQQLNE